MLRLIPAPAAAHFTNLERGGSALPETLNLLIMALMLSDIDETSQDCSLVSKEDPY